MATADFRKKVDDTIAAGDVQAAARLLAAVWSAEPAAAMAGFVASRYERIAPALGLVAKRLAILRSFTVEPLIPLLKAGTYTAGIALDIHIGEFNAYAQ